MIHIIFPHIEKSALHGLNLVYSKISASDLMLSERAPFPLKCKFQPHHFLFSSYSVCISIPYLKIRIILKRKLQVNAVNLLINFSFVPQSTDCNDFKFSPPVKFMPQTVNVSLDRTVIAFCINPPNIFQQLILGKNHIRIRK